MMSVAPLPLSPPWCFHWSVTQDTGGRGRWPGPALLLLTPLLSQCPALGEWTPLIVSQHSDVMSWGEITYGSDNIMYHHRWRGRALCLLWHSGCLNIRVWGELLKSPSVNPWDVFLVVISPRISSIYYCFSIEHSNCHSLLMMIQGSVDDIISELLIIQSDNSSPGITALQHRTFPRPPRAKSAASKLRSEQWITETVSS